MLHIGGVPEHFNFPFRYGISSKEFSNAGFDIDWQEFPGGTGAMTEALRNNSIDIAVLLTEGILADISKGNKSKILRFYVKSPLIWAVHTAGKSTVDFRKVEKLKILISRPLSGSHLMGKILAQRYGFKQNDVAFIEVKNLDGALAYFEKNNDAIFLWERFTSQYLVSNNTFKRIDEIETPWPSFVLAASEKALKEKSAEINAFSAFLAQYCARLQNEKDIVSQIAATYDLDLDIAKAWFEKLRWEVNTDLDLDLLAAIKLQMTDLGL